ncbi:sprT-like domain-containing protein Spartan [Anneissia japonica]|uniref:sprT-like domain-containing protein Spartan n=1 Tax=Anneissia japonica TaxID=1529436 RepID=UPI001425AE9D|nr:sprT-like domain-containing protein Spartan [Anneissia japonica]
MNSDLDYEFACLLQAQFDDQDQHGSIVPPRPSSCHSDDKSQRSGGDKPLSIVDERWETLDPTPDVRAMFIEFDNTFFSGKLAGVEIKWSPRMTLCAGVCSYEGRGGLCSIRLSTPLLKLRPRKDLVETLLHEMIHAYLFVTQNNRDRDGHGPEFCKHMNRINKQTGTKISIYHNFQDEVDLYRQHIWRCDGPCRTRKPFFGYVKRAMNRAPSPRDPWWSSHQQSCGGTYHKEKEPEGYGEKKGKRKREEENTKGSKKAKGRDFNSVPAFEGKGRVLNAINSPPNYPTLEQIWSKKQLAVPNNSNKSPSIPVGSISAVTNGNIKPSSEHKDPKKTDTSGTRSNIHGFFGKKSVPSASNGKYDSDSDDKSDENMPNDLIQSNSDTRNGSSDMEARFPGKGRVLGGRTKEDIQNGGMAWLSKESKNTCLADKYKHVNNKINKHRKKSQKILKLIEIVGSDSDSDGDEKTFRNSEIPVIVNKKEESNRDISQHLMNINIGTSADELPKNRSEKAGNLSGAKASNHTQKIDGELNQTLSDMHVNAETCRTEDPAGTVKCPICGCSVLESAINRHLDECLNHSYLSQ